MFTFGLLLQAAAPETTASSSVFHLISSGDPVVQITLLILVIFSIVSWATIFYKALQLRKAQRAGDAFLKLFYSNSESLEEIATQTQIREGNPYYEVFSEALSFVIRKRQNKTPSSVDHDHIEGVLKQAALESTKKLENMLPFLAITASQSPFVGLFGTVWGILQAFWNIGKTGNTSLATVGPAISEALIATAVGLATAIPAIFGYNYLNTQLRKIVRSLNLFTENLTVRLKKEI